MIKAIGSFVAGLFGGEKSQDLILDIIRDKTGVDDMNSKEKVDKLLEYLDKTKHMSKTRRFLAISFVLGLMVFTGTWLLCAIIQHAYIFFAIDTSSLAAAAASENIAKIKVQPIASLQNDIYVMAKEVLQDPVELILGLYFGAQAIMTLRK